MDELKIRKGSIQDIDDICKVYDAARAYMRRCGNPNQWGDGYPTKDEVAQDISAGNCYVGEDTEGEIIMVFAFILGEDPTYQKIEDGRWLNNEPYGTIHRLGSIGKTGGMLRNCVDFCFQFTDNLRVDTHKDNRPMLQGLQRLGFERCGIIYCRDGTPRIAFQKLFSGKDC